MTWLRLAGVAAFLAVAGYCVARLVVAHRVADGYAGRHRAVDVAHVLMGAGMAAMVSPVGGPLSTAGWQVIFLLMACWFVGVWWRERRAEPPADGLGWHCTGLHHAVGALAMLYMLTAMGHGAEHHMTPWLAGPAHVAAPALPVVGWVLVAYFALSAGRLVTMTSWRAAPAGGPAGPVRPPAILLAPRITAGCQAAMALGNGLLLLAMLG